ncbi:S1C family serine protease [Streptomyces jumonjinensis]|uniref:S1C family serine protease n=1 Tax=Streptomyces jumonjinensis TaxID=1945 RepID=UPI0037B9548A
MSTENEGNEGTAQPAAPSVPPVPAAPPGSVPPPVPSAGPAEPEPKPEPAPASGEWPEQPARPAPVPPQQPAPVAPPQQPAPVPPGAVPPAYGPGPYPQEQQQGPGPYPQQQGPGMAQAAAPAPDPAAAAHQQGAGWPPPAPSVLPPYGGGDGAPAWGAPVHPAEPPRRRRSGGLIAAVLVAALVAGGVGGGLGYWAAERNDRVGSTTVSAADTPKDLKRAPGTVSAVAAKALPSVVTIEAKSGGADPGTDPGIGGSGEGQGQGEGGTGTGFVYDQQGHILTNNHVVDSAAEGGTVSVTFSNGKKYDAEVVGRAQGYDVAVLKLKDAPSGLAPLPLGDSEKVAVGDSTIAIGAPFGLSNTVTTGIISAKNRPVASGDANKSSYMSAIQTDASINPGNSGGPLLDERGAVIGINSAIQSTGGSFGQSQAGSIGLGFAIPINQAKNVADQLIKTGKPVYPVIGATVGMTEQGAGATIASQGSGGTPAVTPDGPAAKAGLKAGDVITEFNGKPVDSGPTLIGEIWNHKPGDKVELTYERDGKAKTVTVTLGERTGDST